jgi:pimeloyl-ACP methyl ester carboxylesterase
VTLPTLILRADPTLGGALSDIGYAALRAARPDASFTEFPGSGHVIHAERTQDFVATVSNFLVAGSDR